MSSAFACVVLGALSGCMLLAREPEPITYPGAGSRPIDLYGAIPPAPTPPIESGEAALERAFREDEMLRHLRMIDGKYSGRRRSSLAWTASARFLNEAPAEERRDAETRNEAEPDAAGAGASLEIDGAESEAVLRAAQRRAAIDDGGYWSVAFSSNVRETQVYYVCELALSVAGEPLLPFDARSTCGWRNRKPNG